MLEIKAPDCRCKLVAVDDLSIRLACGHYLFGQYLSFVPHFFREDRIKHFKNLIEFLTLYTFIFLSEIFSVPVEIVAESCDEIVGVYLE